MQNNVDNFGFCDVQEAKWTKNSKIESTLSAIKQEKEEYKEMDIQKEIPIIDVNIFHTPDIEMANDDDDEMIADNELKSVLNRVPTPKCKNRINRCSEDGLKNGKPSKDLCDAKMKCLSSGNTQRESYSHFNMLLSLSRLCLVNDGQTRQERSGNFFRPRRPERNREWQSAWTLESPANDLTSGSSMENVGKNREWKSAQTLESPRKNREWKKAWVLGSPVSFSKIESSVASERAENDLERGTYLAIDKQENNVKSETTMKVEGEKMACEMKVNDDYDEVFYPDY